MDLISRGWLTKFAATLALLYAACVAAPRYLGDIPQFPAVTGDDHATVSAHGEDGGAVILFQNAISAGSGASARL